jgi:hypothetical protein
MHLHLSPYSAAALLALAATAALPAQRTAESEPNDVPAQAQLVQPGMEIEANLAAGESDWFTFTLTATQEVHCQTTGQYSTASFDLAAFLYDASGTTQLAWDDSGKSGLLCDIGCVLPAGTYTCQVIGKTAVLTGDYGFELVTASPAVINAVEGAEPNDSPMSGGTPTPITLGDTVTGDLAPFGPLADRDWWSFSLSNRAIVQAQIDDDGLVPQCDTQGLSAYQEVSPGTWTLNTGLAPLGGKRVLVTMRGAPTAGNYAFEVAGGAPSGTAPFNYTRNGGYGLRTLRIDMPSSFLIAEAPEPDSSPATAGMLILGGDVFGSVLPGDQDWFGFTVTSTPLTLGFMTDDGASAIVDTSIRLYNSLGTQVSPNPTGSTNGASNGVAGNLHGRLIFTVLTPGTYYVSVEPGPAAVGTDYVLYSGGAAPMRVSSTVVFGAASNGCPGSNTLTPTLDARRGELPQVGSLNVTRLTNALPNTIAVGAYGFDNSAPGLPLDLVLIGMPSCFARLVPEVYWNVFADVTGTAYFDINWAPSYSAVGQTIFMQALCFDPAANAFGFSISNDVQYVLGNRDF